MRNLNGNNFPNSFFFSFSFILLLYSSVREEFWNLLFWLIKYMFGARFQMIGFLLMIFLFVFFLGVLYFYLIMCLTQGLRQVVYRWIDFQRRNIHYARMVLIDVSVNCLIICCCVSFLYCKWKTGWGLAVCQPGGRICGSQSLT